MNLKSSHAAKSVSSAGEGGSAQPPTCQRLRPARGAERAGLLVAPLVRFEG